MPMCATSKRPAFSKESDENERVLIRLRTGYGTWEMTQIAGAVARRIVPYVAEGQSVAKGERVGMIRFGSRVDLLVRTPPGMTICVSTGDRVKAGETPLAVHSGERKR